MKLGGLFSGVGGFELAWTQLGHEVAWMCEIDRSARKVLEQRFPGVPVYEDVEQLDPAEVEAVDVLTGGSPCQGFSVAGTRSGLEHGESRLFADYVRIMDGLAERGLKWALWENVPGVLSITNDDGEKTFEHVVAALAGAAVPVRLGQGRWNTGLADGGGRAVAWRVLDSRYFGVAQRRRRVFACVAFGDSAADRAGRALLAKSEGVSGDSASGGPSGEGAAGGVEKGVGDALGSNWQSGGDARGLDLTDQPSALTTQQTPAVLMTMREGKPGGGKGPLMVEEESLTLATGNGQTLFQPEIPIQDTREVEKKQNGMGVGEPGDPSFTLDTASRPGVAHPKAFSVREDAKAGNFSANPIDVSNALQAHQPASSSHHAQTYIAGYGVRRLTPVECERLQSFPDGWTEPAGSDSARYKAMGNAVTVNTVRWILGRMLEQS